MAVEASRDPNRINDHLAVAFEDIIAEPDGAHSLNCVWRCAFVNFTCFKKLCYVIPTTLCGICIAAEWGCEFAYIAFTHVWIITPTFKVLEINCGFMKKVYGLFVHCCLDPICDSCGLLFSAFRRT